MVQHGQPIFIKEMVYEVDKRDDIVSPAESLLQMSVLACKKRAAHLLHTLLHGEVSARVILEGLGNPKVDQVQLVHGILIITYQYVIRLKIAVNEAFFMHLLNESYESNADVHNRE